MNNSKQLHDEEQESLQHWVVSEEDKQKHKEESLDHEVQVVVLVNSAVTIDLLIEGGVLLLKLLIVFVLRVLVSCDQIESKQGEEDIHNHKSS